ncbi:MAG: hypothetical protein A4E61_00243 [Syntrophorhabdus sp. PtaB.Bin184]|nr:MAG: hypothetical protein A4E61_00243 [Syntrophorhabdus sp. PtaB.Bin184]
MSERSRAQSTHKPINLPVKMRLPNFRGFDRFPACHWLRSSITGEIVILEIILKRADDGYRYAFYCITDPILHRDLLRVGIDNDEEARYLYYRFRALNPEFLPVSREGYLLERQRLKVG